MTDERLSQLRRIAAACEEVSRQVSGRTLDVAQQEKLLRTGVAEQLTAIAEGTRRLGEGMDERYPHILWQTLRDMDAAIRDDPALAARTLWPTVESLGKLRQACLLEISVIEKGW